MHARVADSRFLTDDENVDLNRRRDKYWIVWIYFLTGEKIYNLTKN